MRKFAISIVCELNVHLSKPSHTPNRYVIPFGAVFPCCQSLQAIPFDRYHAAWRFG